MNRRRLPLLAGLLASAVAAPSALAQSSPNYGPSPTPSPAERRDRVEPDAAHDRADKNTAASTAADGPRYARLRDAPSGHL
jgi:hypothetical protein